MRRISKTVLSVLGIVWTASLSVQGSIVYDSGGFEAPRFTSAAALVLQDRGRWIGLVTPGDTAVAASIVQFQGGTQGVALTRATPATPTPDAGFWYVNAPIVPTLQNNLVTLSWSMYIDTTQTINRPFFGVDVFDSQGASVTAVGIDAGTGDLVLETAAGTNEYNSAFHDTENTFHSYKVVLNYNAHTFRVSVDGLQRGGDFGFASASADFNDADLTTFNAGTTTMKSSGLAYFDNYTVESMPEPTALVLVTLGLPGLLRRNRQSKAEGANPKIWTGGNCKEEVDRISARRCGRHKTG